MRCSIQLSYRALFVVTEVNRGVKDRQASFPTKRPLVKTRKKKKSAPAGSLALPRVHRIADADPPGPSVTAHRRSIPLPKLRNQRRLRSAAGPPGEFATALALPPKSHGPARVVQRHLAGPPCGSQAPFLSFRRSRRPGFPVRMGCSRTVMVPR